MSVQFTAQETSKVPARLRPLMQQYPLAFDNLLEAFGKKEIAGTIQSLDIYFDDQLLPALSFIKEQHEVQVMSRVSPEDPKVLTVFANDECGYVQIEDRVLLNRIGDEFLEVFEI
jgi:hypothetical protein